MASSFEPIAFVDQEPPSGGLSRLQAKLDGAPAQAPMGTRAAIQLAVASAGVVLTLTHAVPWLAMARDVSGPVQAPISATEWWRDEGGLPVHPAFVTWGYISLDEASALVGSEPVALPLVLGGEATPASDGGKR